MLIAIGALVLVVVFLASKPVPGDQKADGSGLPQPSPVPATGTTGVPSPATSFTTRGNPGGFGAVLMGTNAGQLIAQTNLEEPSVGWRGNPPLPPSSTVTNTPQSTPLLAKELVTNERALAPLLQATSFNGLGPKV
jgi:hypothetical protein